MDEHTSHELAYKKGYEDGKPKWIPVTERLPEKQGKYLCRYVFGDETKYAFGQVLYYFTDVQEPHFQHEGSLGLRVTHWCELPGPPKGE